MFHNFGIQEPYDDSEYDEDEDAYDDSDYDEDSYSDSEYDEDTSEYEDDTDEDSSFDHHGIQVQYCLLEHNVYNDHEQSHSVTNNHIFQIFVVDCGLFCRRYILFIFIIKMIESFWFR